MKNKGTLIALFILAATLASLAPYATNAWHYEDTTPPNIEIDYPRCEIAQPQNITITGTAFDDNFVDYVEVMANNGSWVNASIEYGNYSPDLWSASVPLVPRTNNIAAKAVDAAGNSNETSIVITCTSNITDITPPQILE